MDEIKRMKEIEKKYDIPVWAGSVKEIHMWTDIRFLQKALAAKDRDIRDLTKQKENLQDSLVAWIAEAETAKSRLEVEKKNTEEMFQKYNELLFDSSKKINDLENQLEGETSRADDNHKLWKSVIADIGNLEAVLIATERRSREVYDKYKHYNQISGSLLTDMKNAIKSICTTKYLS